MGYSNYATKVAIGIMELLAERKIAAYTLADKAGIARTTMQRRLIDGEFTVTELQRIAVVLDVDVLTILKRQAA